MTADALVWPDVNTLGWVRLADYGSELPTRFEDHEGESVVIGIPFGPEGETLVPPASSDHFFIGWPIDRAAIEVPVSLIDVQHEPIPVWKCDAVGPPTETQRRRFVRVECEIDFEMHMFQTGDPIAATTTDLSEGGMRALVDHWAGDPGLRHIPITLPLETATMEVSAQVVWWGNLQPDGRRLAGMRFVELANKDADTIRRNVFALQLEQRKNRAR